MAQVDAQGFAAGQREFAAGGLVALVEQRGQVVQAFPQLGGEVTDVLGDMADDAGRARGQQPRLHRVAVEHRAAREAGRHRPVFARVTPGRRLPRVFQRDGRRLRTQRHHLQPARHAVAADGRGGRRRLVEHAVHGAGAADAEAPVALLVALAFVDGGEVVPDADQVGVRGRPHLGQQPGIGPGRGGFDVAAGFGFLDHAHDVVAVAAPGFDRRAGEQAAVDRAGHGGGGSEDEGDQGVGTGVGRDAQARGRGGVHCWWRL